MKDLKLLFLAPHWRVSLIRAFQEARVRDNIAVRLIGADSDPLAPSLQVVDEPLSIPRFDDPACLSALLEICRREPVSAILPMTNRAVEFLDRHRQDFNRGNGLIYLQSAETIAVCHDKLKLAEFCRREGIPSPRTGEPEAFPGTGAFPLMAKPRRGEGGKNNFIVDNRRELEFYAQKYPCHVFQEYIEGREFTIDWFSDRRGNPVVIVPRERLAVRGGEVMASRICMDREIIELARLAGTRLKLQGPANLQGIRARNGQFLFTDINLRFGSGSGHTIAAGGDMPGLIYRELSGEPIALAMDSVKDGNLMTRFHDAFYFCPSDAATERKDPSST